MESEDVVQKGVFNRIGCSQVIPLRERLLYAEYQEAFQGRFKGIKGNLGSKDP